MKKSILIVVSMFFLGIGVNASNLNEQNSHLLENNFSINIHPLQQNRMGFDLSYKDTLSEDGFLCKLAAKYAKKLLRKNTNLSERTIEAVGKAVEALCDDLF